MKIEIKEVYGSKLSDGTRSRLLEAFKFASTELGLDEVEHTVHVKIKDHIRESSFLLGSVEGTFVYSDIKTLPSIITLRNGPFRNMSRTIFHEMAHLKQFIFNQLVITDDVSMWKGVRVNTQKISYFNLPWEIDARAYERSIGLAWRRKKRKEFVTKLRGIFKWRNQKWVAK